MPRLGGRRSIRKGAVVMVFDLRTGIGPASRPLVSTRREVAPRPPRVQILPLVCEMRG
jgi:hypothetical protein